MSSIDPLHLFLNYLLSKSFGKQCITLKTDKASFSVSFVERVTFRSKIGIVKIINSVHLISFFISFVWLVSLIFKKSSSTALFKTKNLIWVRMRESRKEMH